MFATLFMMLASLTVFIFAAFTVFRSGIGLIAVVVVGSAIALAGTALAVVFARGLFIKQRQLIGQSRLFAWLLLTPHVVVSASAFGMFVFLLAQVAMLIPDLAVSSGSALTAV